MTKRYLVVSNGAAKKTGEVYSRAYKIAKDSKGFEWLDQKDVFFTDNIRPVGTVIEVEQCEVK